VDGVGVLPGTFGAAKMQREVGEIKWDVFSREPQSLGVSRKWLDDRTAPTPIGTSLSVFTLSPEVIIIFKVSVTIVH
jgi:hypothetical protein